MDRPYRVSVGPVAPIVVHAASSAQAVEIFLEYLRQPKSGRIIVEPTECVHTEPKSIQ